MELVYTKQDLETLEDRFENFFSLPYETIEMPDSLSEINDVPYTLLRNKLLKENFSLLICLPHLPVFKELKSAELLKDNLSFRLLKISSENYNLAIEEFLKKSEYASSFIWIQDFKNVVVEMPKTSQQRMKLSNLGGNQIYSFWLEIEECTMAVWD